jgi:N-acetyl-gamma-glutamyl-phosphate reductase
VKVVDLSSDHRFDTQWRYGLPELFEVKDATAVASPGCYPTATLLAIGPLVAAKGVSSTGIVADCLSGVSGAGRSLKEELLFGEVAEGVHAYGVTTHRHRPEIEMGLQMLGAPEAIVTFTPHLVPMQRGLLATVTAKLTNDLNPAEILGRAYEKSPFVEVLDSPPQTRWTVGSNRALVAAFVDERQGVVIAQCALDNLMKGAAGQAVQAANLMVGYDETEGLPVSGWMP